MDDPDGHSSKSGSSTNSRNTRDGMYAIGANDTLSSSPSKNNQEDGVWVGAFERVMGDHTSNTSSTLSSSRQKSRLAPRSPEPSRQAVSSAFGRGEDVSAAYTPNSRSGHASPLRNQILDESSKSVPRNRIRSGSLGTATAGAAVTAPISLPNTISHLRSARPATPRSLSAGLSSRFVQQNFGPNLIVIKPSGTVNFEGLYINHAPGVQMIHVINTSTEHQVLLRLSSTLGRALTFSKPKRSQPDIKDTIFYPTNTSKWAGKQGLHPSKLRDLRHLVSNLEPADSLILQPQQGLDIFLTFRPNEVEKNDKNVGFLAPPRSPTPSGGAVDSSNVQSTIAPHSLDSAASSQSSITGLNDTSNASPRSAPDMAPEMSTEGSNHFNFATEVMGSVAIRASVLSMGNASMGEEMAFTNAGLQIEGLSSNASNLSSNSSSRPPSYYGSHLSSVTSAPTSESLTSGDDIQTVQIPFYASICRPQLFVTRHRHHGKATHQSTGGAVNLNFGDLFIGQKEEMDFYLHNLSDIEVYWQARIDDADSMLGTPPITILDDQGQKVLAVTSGEEVAYRPNMLTEVTTKRIRIIVEPHETCRDFEQVITITNLHNASNSFRIIIRANMLAEARDDALSIVSGDKLDFGDCAGGHWTRQLLILKNTCEQFLDVHFAVEKGIEADFQLAENVQPEDEDEEEKYLQEEPPPLMESQSVESSSVDTFSESGASDQKSRPTRSPSLSSVNLLQHNGNADAIKAAESARTPTSYAQKPDSKDDPPALTLEDKEKACGLVRKESSEDEVDASSVASQAGSAPNSPSRSLPVQLSKDLVLEPPAYKPISGNTSSLGEVHSEVDSSNDGGERRFFSRPTSMLFSSRPNSSRGRFSQPRTHDGILDDSASVRSDLTAVSHDSRIGPFISSTSHAGSSHHHSGNGVGSSHLSAVEKARMVRHGGAAALRGIGGNEQAHGNQIEELILRPGAEYRVIVSHRPKRGEIDEAYSQGRLQEKTFNLILDYARLKSSRAKQGGGRERKTIPCRTRTCTSFITISPKVIDFGRANVGARKSANFVVKNQSELTARVDLRFVSKVISMYRDEVAVPPLQSIELRVDFFPRRVNESYRKQVTVANLLNRSNDQILEVRSSNMDEERISFHSLFYRILTPTGSNFIDFGDVNINCTRVRTFAIENASKAPLSLEFSAANPEDLKLYVKAVRKISNAGPSDQSKGIEISSNPGDVDKETNVETNVPPSEKESYAPSAPHKAKRTIHLKERFLELMTHDVPTSVRNENSTWRIAQKQSHYLKKGSGHTKNGEKSDKKDPAKKPNINMVAALKKGGKGRLVQRYGKSMTFKDRQVLSTFEYLDLASGPPIDGKRISAKSKKWQTLDANETGKSTSTSKKKGLSIVNGTGIAKEDVETDPATPHLPQIIPSTPTKEVSSFLPNEIQQLKSQQNDQRKQSPALTGKRKAAPMLHDAVDVSKLSLDELLAAVEAQNSSLSTFFFGNSKAEEQSVRTEVNLQRELRNAIQEGRLQPADMLTLKPGEERQVIAIYTPNGSTRPHIQGNARKQDSRIFIRLADFSTNHLSISSSPPNSSESHFSDLLKLDKEELPIRDLMVKSNICRSLLELSQPHINFGHVQKGETKTRKILIQNRSEWALRYCIRKSGSIASGDIKIKSTDRYGIVPGHGRREVEFVFCPSLTGTFQEKLIVENVADRDRDETVLIKATVTRVSNFTVEPSSVRFVSNEDDGKPLPIGQMINQAQYFTISNLSSKTRSFVLRIDKDDLRYGAYHVEVILSNSKVQQDAMKATLTKAEEEEIEHISQKLKIARRKGHEEKVEKYEKRLTELGIPIPKSSGTEDPSKGENANEVPFTDEPQTIDKQEGLSHEVSANLMRTASNVTIDLPAQQSKRFLVRLRPLGVVKPDVDHHYHHLPIDVRIPIQIHEVKNIDELQTVEVRATMQANKDFTTCPITSQHDMIVLPGKEVGLAIFNSRYDDDAKTSSPSPPIRDEKSS